MIFMMFMEYLSFVRLITVAFIWWFFKFYQNLHNISPSESKLYLWIRYPGNLSRSSQFEPKCHPTLGT